MKKIFLAAAAAIVMVSGAAQAERYVMVTHGEGCLLYTSPSPRDS